MISTIIRTIGLIAATPLAVAAPVLGYTAGGLAYVSELADAASWAILERSGFNTWISTWRAENQRKLDAYDEYMREREDAQCTDTGDA